MNIERCEHPLKRAVRLAAPEKARAPAGGWATYSSHWGHQ